MDSFLYPEVPRVVVLRSLSCSQSIRQRMRRRTVTLCFNLHWNSQILVHRSQGMVQLDLLSPLRKTPLLHRSMLSSSEALIQISQCGYRYEPPIPSCSSSRLGHPQSRCPRRLCSCQHVSVFRCVGFPTRYLAARFNGIRSNSRGSPNIWAKCFAVSARPNLSWANGKSLTQADLCRVAPSFFRNGLRLPSDTSLSCSFSRGVLTASVFVLHPDSLVMSGSISRYCPV